MLTYVGGTAAPGTYGGVEVTATDADGAVLHGVFTLVVHANAVYVPGNYGDEVNPNGTGAQLRGGTAPTSWGGSVYTWTDYAHLPG